MSPPILDGDLTRTTPGATPRDQMDRAQRLAYARAP